MCSQRALSRYKPKIQEVKKSVFRELASWKLKGFPLGCFNVITREEMQWLQTKNQTSGKLYFSLYSRFYPAPTRQPTQQSLPPTFDTKLINTVHHFITTTLLIIKKLIKLSLVERIRQDLRLIYMYRIYKFNSPQDANPLNFTIRGCLVTCGRCKGI